MHWRAANQAHLIGSYIAHQPPSTGSTAPVMNECSVGGEEDGGPDHFFYAPRRRNRVYAVDLLLEFGIVLERLGARHRGPR